MSDIEKILYPSTRPDARPTSINDAMLEAVQQMAAAADAVARGVRFGLLSLSYLRPEDPNENNRDRILRELQLTREAIDGLSSFLAPTDPNQGNLF